MQQNRARSPLGTLLSLRSASPLYVGSRAEYEKSLPRSLPLLGAPFGRTPPKTAKEHSISKMVLNERQSDRGCVERLGDISQWCLLVIRFWVFEFLCMFKFCQCAKFERGCAVQSGEVRFQKERLRTAIAALPPPLIADIDECVSFQI